MIDRGKPCTNCGSTLRRPLNAHGCGARECLKTLLSSPTAPALCSCPPYPVYICLCGQTDNPEDQRLVPCT